jgi:hypothetical protein
LAHRHDRGFWKELEHAEHVIGDRRRRDDLGSGSVQPHRLAALPDLTLSVSPTPTFRQSSCYAANRQQDTRPKAPRPNSARRRIWLGGTLLAEVFQWFRGGVSELAGAAIPERRLH